MTCERVRAVEEDGLAVLTFDLPGEKVNKLSSAVVAELADVLVRLAARGPTFAGSACAAASPTSSSPARTSRSSRSANDDSVRTMVERGQALFEQLAHLPYPTVAAINGVCLGGGTELALACDYRLMSDSPKAQIGLPGGPSRHLPGVGRLHAAAPHPRARGRARPDPDGQVSRRPTRAEGRARGRGRAGGDLRRVGAAVRARESSAAPSRGPAGGPSSFAARALEATPLGRGLIFAQGAAGRAASRPAATIRRPSRRSPSIEEGYGKPVAAGLEAEAGTSCASSAARCSGTCSAIFFATEEVKKETGVSGSRRSGRARSRASASSARASWAAASRSSRRTRAFPARMKDIDAEGARRAGSPRRPGSGRNRLRKRRLTPREMATEDGPALGHARLLGIRAVRRHDRGGRREARRQAGGPSRTGRARFPASAIFASNTSTLPITRDRRRGRRPRPRRRDALLQSRAQDAARRGDPGRPHDGRDRRRRSSRSPRRSGRRRSSCATRPGFLVNRILAPYLVGGGAPRARRLPHRGRRRGDDATSACRSGRSRSSTTSGSTSRPRRRRRSPRRSRSA